MLNLNNNVVKLDTYKTLIKETLIILNTLNLIQKKIKMNHFNQAQIDFSLKELEKLTSEKGKIINK